MTNNGFNNDFDNFFKRAGGAFLAWFIFCAVLGLVVLGVVIWAVIALVTHFTGS